MNHRWNNAGIVAAFVLLSWLLIAEFSLLSSLWSNRYLLDDAAFINRAPRFSYSVKPMEVKEEKETKNVAGARNDAQPISFSTGSPTTLSNTESITFIIFDLD